MWFSDEELPTPASKNCGCICHRVPGVIHAFPCCFPSEQEDLKKIEEISPKTVDDQ